jgi:hypothetical protein
VPVDGFFEWRAIRGVGRKQPYAIAPEELRDIESALSEIKVQGERYPASLQARVGR